MAPPVYSLRIFATGELDPGAGTVGPVVPAGLIYVLRDIDVQERTGTNGAFMHVLNPLGGVLTAFQRTAAVPLGVESWRGRQVYSEGEQVGFAADSGSWAIMASGYQLTLP